MEVLTLNGQRYVKASKAARDLGYASDYVGQLCRKGAVDAHLVGRTWYVNPDTLGAHRVEKKRNARVKAREHARRSIEEARSLNVETSSKNQKTVAIHYEGDGAGLIPEVRKVEIDSFREKVDLSEVEENSERFSIENKDKKIVMSGTVAVHDAELEEQYADTTVLTPKIVKHRSSVHTSHIMDAPTSERPHVVTFQERIAPVATDEEPMDATNTVQGEAEPDTRSHSGGLTVTLILMLCFSIISLASILFATEVAVNNGTLESSLVIDDTTVSDFIAKNIDISDKP